MYRKSLLIVSLAVVTLSCCSGGSVATLPPNTELATLLLNGTDDVRLRKLTNDILNDRERVRAQDVSDDRTVAPNTLLRTSYGERDYQLGVDTVSDYVICLLEIRNHTSTLGVLRRTAPSLAKMCSDDRSGCDVCNSQSVPVDKRIKDELQRYWRSTLIVKK